MLKYFTKQEKSWIYYDWANSAYSAIVTAAILPTFFAAQASAAGVDEVVYNVWFSWGTSAATLLVALLAPILGTMADYQDTKMRMFGTFLALAIGSTAALALPVGWQGLLTIYMITIIGFSGANVFYDSFLVDVTTSQRMDRVSTYGFALGYIGGSTIPFLAAIGLISFHQQLGITETMAVRFSFLLTAVWWLLFSIPMLKNVRQVYGVQPQQHFVRGSFGRLWQTMRHIRHYKQLVIFLIAYFFYIDGVGTIIHMSTVYGKALGLNTNSMIIALLVTQIVAFPCAIIFGRLAERWGAKTMLYYGIGIYILVCFVGFYMVHVWQFWLLAVLVGTAQGGIQAISRSFYGKMVPKDRAAEFFGFFDIFGRFAAIMGPLLYGTITSVTRQPRYGVLSLLSLFIIGGIVLYFVNSNPQAIELVDGHLPQKE